MVPNGTSQLVSGDDTDTDHGDTDHGDTDHGDTDHGDTDHGPDDAWWRRRPIYWRLLRLRRIAPNWWQRLLLADGSIAIAALLVLADVATAWTLVVLPLATALVVKAHDLLAGVLDPPPASAEDGTSGRRAASP